MKKKNKINLKVGTCHINIKLNAKKLYVHGHR